MTEAPIKVKPKLRGYFHQEAFYFTLGATLLLLVKCTTTPTLLSALVYSFGLLLMFGISALYHRVNWQPKPRAILKRLDHSAIYILIASTATPLCLLSLPDKEGFQFLILMWSVAAVGILQSVFWGKAPKYISAIFYVGMGWLALPYLTQMKESLGQTDLILIFSGGIVYTVGALFYALKWPKLAPHLFGYHELFHIFTIIGATLHFIVIYKLIY